RAVDLLAAASAAAAGSAASTCAAAFGIGTFAFDGVALCAQCIAAHRFAFHIRGERGVAMRANLDHLIVIIERPCDKNTSCARGTLCKGKGSGFHGNDAPR